MWGGDFVFGAIPHPSLRSTLPTRGRVATEDAVPATVSHCRTKEMDMLVSDITTRTTAIIPNMG